MKLCRNHQPDRHRQGGLSTDHIRGSIAPVIGPRTPKAHVATLARRSNKLTIIDHQFLLTSPCAIDHYPLFDLLLEVYTSKLVNRCPICRLCGYQMRRVRTSRRTAELARLLIRLQRLEWHSVQEVGEAPLQRERGICAIQRSTSSEIHANIEFRGFLPHWRCHHVLRPRDASNGQHSLSCRYHTASRTSANVLVLCQATEMERLSIVHAGHHPDSSSVDLLWVYSRGIWSLHLIWRILQDDSWLCVQHTCGWTISGKSAANGGRKSRGRNEKQRAARMKQKWEAESAY